MNYSEIIAKTNRIVHKNRDILSQLGRMFLEMQSEGLSINIARIQALCDDFCALIELFNAGIAKEMAKYGVGVDINKAIAEMNNIISGVENNDIVATCNAELALHECLNSYVNPLNSFYQYFNAERIVTDSILFDSDWYEQKYADRFSKEEMTPAHHYAYFGWKEGLDPSPYFSTSEYISDNPQVGSLCPLYHYEEFGIFSKA